MKTSEKEKGFKVRPAWQDNLLSLFSILSVIAGTLAAVVLIVWVLYISGILPTSLSELFAGPRTPTAETTDDVPDYEILRQAAADDNAAAEASAVRFSGNFDTLYALLAETPPADSYYLRTDFSLFSDGKETAHTVSVWRDGERFRIEREKKGERGMIRYICDGTFVQYTNTAAKESAVFPSSSAFSMEALAGIPTVNAFSARDSITIDAASYLKSGSGIMYYIRFHYPPLTDSDAGSVITEEYWITPENEFVSRSRTYAGDKEGTDNPMLYSSSAKEFRPLTDSEKSSLFSISGKDS
ncbi:MAG: hypothetical protein MJ175_11435 [Clostridia bacterium]|nr:hypothetical protein [Clostridia bacterium]